MTGQLFAGIHPIGRIIILITLIKLIYEIYLFVISAFRAHILWGLIVIFVPVLGPMLYILRHWVECGQFVVSVLFCVGFLALVYIATPFVEHFIIQTLTYHEN